MVGGYKSDVEEGNPMMSKSDSILVKLEALRVNIKQSLIQSNKEMDRSFANFRDRIIMSGIFLVLMISFIAYLTAVSLVKRVKYVTKQIQKLAEGHLPKTQLETANDEIGRMAYSLNSLIKGLREKAQFAEEIGKGNFQTHLQAERNDVLGIALAEMRSSLENASEEAELRRVETMQRTWSSQGIAKFNEIIREYNDKPEKFFIVTISELTKYLGAQVGGMYIVNNDNENIQINLEGFYAYGRQKFEKKTITPGENLVGQCYLEKETIYMTDIPKNYVKISSGLGKDDPQSLLIIPLKINEEVFGVAEIASLKVLEKHEIDFAEKAGEIIASTISNIKVNRQTTILLEESNEKSERLAKQEEETRKVIEDLEKSKDELIIREKTKDKKFIRIEDEYKNEIKTLTKKLKLSNDNLTNSETEFERYRDVLNSALMITETDMNGQILKTNKKFINTAGISYLDISGKSIDKFLEKKRANSKEYLDSWRQLQSGERIELVNDYFFKGQKMTFRDTYTPFQNNNNKYYKIIIASVKINIQKEEE